MFLHFLTLMWSVAFLCLASCLSYAVLSHVGLSEVPVTYLGSLGYFPAWGPELPDGRPSESLLVVGGPVCATSLAWSCILIVHTPPPGHCQLSTGGSDAAPPEQVHNHNLGSVRLNYPCPVSRLRVVSHNRTKRRRAGPMSKITLCLSYPCRFTTHSSDPEWRLTPPPSPTGAWGLAFDVFRVDSGHSRISDTTSQGPHHQSY
jgi:hypothetical protein